MPNRIKPLRSYTANAVPTTSDLETNELAINWADGKAYTKNAAGNIVSVTLGGSGGGAVEDARWGLFLPPAPTGLTATAGNASAALSWTAPSGVIAQAPITDYREQYSTDGGATWTTFTAAASTTASATVTGLTNGTAYRFRVAAVNAVGVGAYTAASAAVTPVAGDALWSSVQLLLPGDTSIADASSYSRSVTAVGGAGVSTAQKRWGAGSLAFNGSGQYLSVADSSDGFAFGAGDFCYEFWFRSTATNAYCAMLTRPYNSPGGILLSLNGSSGNGRPEIYWREYANAMFLQSDTGGFNDGAWHHYAFNRSGTTCRLYIDGILRGSVSGVSTPVPTSTVVVGTDVEYAGRDFAGNIDDLRVTVGSARGYTGSTIPVPVAAFPTS